MIWELFVYTILKNHNRMAQIELFDKKGKRYDLSDKDEIARGGEGRIMLCPFNQKKVIKLYHKNKKAISPAQFNALKQLNNGQFIIPETLLYQNGQTAGFIMDYADSDYFSFSNLFNANFCRKHKVDNRIKIRTAQNLRTALSFVHRNNCIIGDLNPYNILCNKKGDLKFIDTDSYGSPAQKHNGLVLEEVRDFQKNGQVNKESDYFALAVLIFYLFTQVHPFKGIHPQYRNLKDRMIQGLPIISNDKSIKIPNCYQPISNPDLIAQFKAMFIHGERFLLSPDGIIEKSLTRKAKPLPINTLEENNLIIRPLLQNEAIIDVYFNEVFGFAETTDNFILYKSENNALPKQKAVLSKNLYDRLFISESQIIMRKGEDLFYLSESNTAIPIKNFKLPAECLISQHESILSIISDNTLYILYINDMSGNNIRIKREQVYAPSFSDKGALLQSLAGVNRVFYNTGKDLATIKTDINPKALLQKNNIFFMQYLENQKIMQRFVRAEGLQLFIANAAEDAFSDFACKRTGKYHGLIFIPKSGEIIIKRTEDFTQTTVLKCRFITEQSRLFYTNSGLVALEGNNLFLLNMK